VKTIPETGDGRIGVNLLKQVFAMRGNEIIFGNLDGDETIFY